MLPVLLLPQGLAHATQLVPNASNASLGDSCGGGAGRGALLQYDALPGPDPLRQCTGERHASPKTSRPQLWAGSPIRQPISAPRGQEEQHPRIVGASSGASFDAVLAALRAEGLLPPPDELAGQHGQLPSSRPSSVHSKGAPRQGQVRTADRRDSCRGLHGGGAAGGGQRSYSVQQAVSDQQVSTLPKFDPAEAERRLRAKLDQVGAASAASPGVWAYHACMLTPLILGLCRNWPLASCARRATHACRGLRAGHASVACAVHSPLGACHVHLPMLYDVSPPLQVHASKRGSKARVRAAGSSCGPSPRRQSAAPPAGVPRLLLASLSLAGSNAGSRLHSGRLSGREHDWQHAAAPEELQGQPQQAQGGAPADPSAVALHSASAASATGGLPVVEQGPTLVASTRDEQGSGPASTGPATAVGPPPPPRKESRISLPQLLASTPRGSTSAPPQLFPAPVVPPAAAQGGPVMTCRSSFFVAGVASAAAASAVAAGDACSGGSPSAGATAGVQAAADALEAGARVLPGKAAAPPLQHTPLSGCISDAGEVRQGLYPQGLWHLLLGTGVPLIRPTLHRNMLLPADKHCRASCCLQTFAQAGLSAACRGRACCARGSPVSSSPRPPRRWRVQPTAALLQTQDQRATRSLLAR